jgi:hypothetical protein
MRNKLFTGMLAMALAFGLALAGCPPLDTRGTDTDRHAEFRGKL